MAENALSAHLLKTNSREKWKRTGLCKKAGLLAPLSCFHSKKSLGIGDLADLKLLIDWCKETGNSILQLLPMNEVGPLFCPYDSVSSFALEPVYLSLDQMQNDKSSKKIDDLRLRFRGGKKYVDYGIKKEKLRLLREIFIEQKDEDSADFRRFEQDNAYWLNIFVLYKALKESQQQRAWYEWEGPYRNRERKALDEFSRKNQREINFQKWLQWKLYKQFRQAKEYAGSKNISLKGDLPILVSRDSADVWAHQEFFKLDLVAGAPPDLYCAKGQRWGMSTYNWEKIAADRYRYLKEKLRYAQEFYDILRIDHVVGLFRIWSIPYDDPVENKGLNGFFDPPDESTWKERGRNILSVILNNTKMLLCAEDLGTIPKSCPETLYELGIPGNDVQRWVKDWNIRHDFLKPQEFRALSVAMLSTHDTTNWPDWWENEAGTVDEELFIRKCSDHRRIDFGAVKEKLFNSKLSRHGRLRWLEAIDSEEELVSILGKKKEDLADFIDLYLNSFREKEKLWRRLGLKGPMREKCDAQVLRSVMKFCLGADSIFCINTIFDYLYLADGIFKELPHEYRINFPGTISDKNWSLTVPLSLEALMKHKVTKQIRSLIVDSDRA